MDDGESKRQFTKCLKCIISLPMTFSLLILYVDAVDGRMSVRNKRTAVSFKLIYVDYSSRPVYNHYRLTILPVVVCFHLTQQLLLIDSLRIVRL